MATAVLNRLKVHLRYFSYIPLLTGQPIREHKVRRASYPRILYKYFPPQRVDLFRTGMVRFSQFRALNDPLEFGVVISEAALNRFSSLLLKVVFEAVTFGIIARLPFQVYRQAKESEDFKKLNRLARLIFPIMVAWIMIKMIVFLIVGTSEIRATFRSQLRDLFTKGIYDTGMLVFSCSATHSSIPMWAHYAANHSGFQIGFDPEFAFRVTSAKGKVSSLTPMRVDYVRQLHSPSNDPWMIGKIATTKLSDWSYEKEWRFTTSPEFAPIPTEVDQRDLPLFYLTMNLRSIREVSFGYLTTDEFISEVRRACVAADLSVSFWKIGSDGVRYRLPDPIEGVPAGDGSSLLQLETASKD